MKSGMFTMLHRLRIRGLKLTGRLLWFLILVLSAWLLGGMAEVMAQNSEEWDPPVWLSERVFDESGSPASSIGLTLASDPWNQVHAIWISKIDPNSPAVGDTLYYAHGDGVSWSEPSDIYFSSNSYMTAPQTTVDSNGWLHLVWVNNGRALYGRAYVPDAASATAWHGFYPITDESTSNVAIAVGPTGTVHAVYCSTGERARIAYVSSTDGESWSVPTHIADVDGCWARIAVDGNERLHVVYTNQPGVGAGTAAFYVGSGDGGKTWSAPLQLDQKDSRYTGEYGPSWANVIALGDNEVHLVWDGAPAGQRWHKWSKDGGKIWSRSERILGDHRGLTGPNALAADSEGNIHMISLGWPDYSAETQGPFHTTWNGSEWSPIQLVSTRTNWGNAEVPALAILGGNRLVAGWRNTSDVPGSNLIEVWASTLKTDVRGTAPQPRPTSSPTPSVEDTVIQETPSVPDATAVEPTATPDVAPVASEASPPRSMPLQNIVSISMLPVLLIITVLVFWRLRRRR